MLLLSPFTSCIFLYMYLRNANLLRKKKVFLRMKKVFWLEKQYFSFCFHRSVHKVILEKKKYFEAFCSNSQGICNLKKVLKYCKKGNSWHLWYLCVVLIHILHLLLAQDFVFSVSILQIFVFCSCFVFLSWLWKIKELDLELELECLSQKSLFGLWDIFEFLVPFLDLPICDAIKESAAEKKWPWTKN